MQLGICLALAFGYWALYNSGITMGQHGLVPPVVAAWGANTLAILLAVFLLRRLKR
jgi:lipopolysaccharide export system permease protein